MAATLKTFVRTAQTFFPSCVDAKFALMRSYRRLRRVPFDRDFNGIRLLPGKDDALFLDVGGNRGQSVDAILMLTRRSRVEVFEPNPLLCTKLERQFSGNQRVAINRVGLGRVTATQSLYVPFYRNWMFDGLASFDKDKAADWLDGRILGYRQELVSLRQVTCEMKPLDDLRLEPFFIKIDVQGYEYQVIRGGERTIQAHEPVLLIEAPPEDAVTAYLTTLGYRAYTFRDDRFIEGIAGGNNTFFMTAKTSSVLTQHIILREDSVVDLTRVQGTMRRFVGGDGGSFAAAP